MTVTSNYKFKMKPYTHQLNAFKISADERLYAYFMEMGTGKTKVTIDNIAYLWDNGEISGALIVAPKGVYMNWVYTELPKHMPDHIEYDVAVWKSYMKKKDKELLGDLFMADGRLKIFVVNVETFSSKKSPGLTIIRKFLNAHTCMWALDESTTIKNPDAIRTKMVLDLSPRAKYRRILSGEPMTRSPMDLYSQCAFLSHKLLGFSSYYAFRNRYAILEDQVVKQRGNLRRFKTIVGFQRQDELKTNLQEFSFRIKKRDCLDLPDKIYHTRYVEMSKELRKAYDEFKANSVLELENGEIVSAPMVMTKLMRLHQIACGFINDDNKTATSLGKDRLSTLADVIENEILDGKVIIWATYVHNIKEIYGMLSEAYGHVAVGHLYGGTPDDLRQKYIERFQDPGDKLRFLVGNPQTGGYGLTLTEGKTVIYYSNSFNLEIRLQSEDRAHRVGQTDHVNYIDLCCKDTVDEYVMSNLRGKKDMIQDLMDKGWKKIFDLI